MEPSDRDAERDRLSAAISEPAAGRSPIAQLLVLFTGIGFLLLGLAGFAVTGVGDFVGHNTGAEVLWFEVNGLHNLLHLTFGVCGLVLWRTDRGAIGFGWLVTVTYTVIFLYGLIAIGDEADVLSLNRAGNWLHAGLAAWGLVIAGLAIHELRPPRATDPLRAGQQPVS